MSTASAAPRLAPLAPPFEPDLAIQLAKWMPPGSELEPLALFRTLYLNGELADRMRPLGAGILGSKASVPPKLREVMIDRTCALTGAEYEWGVHAAAFADAVGLDEERLRSTVHGSHRDACWDRAEASVFRLADELHHSNEISDELWLELAERFSPAQIIELIVTAGWYHVIAYLCNGLGVEREPWAPRFPGLRPD
ncbi:MAG: carboxymuconolactone decarboxylase family protein [Solirubrobacteraceae bacterium]